MKTIDKEYESVVEAIETRERDILRQLQEFVNAESSAISKLVGQVARVDALLSLANFAHKCNLVKPEMIDRGWEDFLRSLQNVSNVMRLTIWWNCHHDFEITRPYYVT